MIADVTTDLLDAAIVFGPQKGARPEDIPVLTQRLSCLDLPRGPRTGAAGGLGARLAWLGAELVDGAERMIDVLDFATTQATPGKEETREVRTGR